ncbi:MAG: hypothetical protein EA352_05155 [Gemmatimonadales bacterium]|nr:MAG: hypothetical protein EA352_05155 [Gemmatimonadales bacterium]
MTFQNLPLAPPRWPTLSGDPRDLGDGRFASTIRTDSPEGCQVALVGLPDDLGVRLNGGRPGAARGPHAFRTAWAGYGARSPLAGELPRVMDVGNVLPGDSLKETHDRVTRVTRRILEVGLLPIAVGGGHDLTFPFVRALAEQTPEPLGGVYLDAHLDVRSEPGSGMPFRALVEECGVAHLHVFGLDPFSNSAEHRAWFAEHGGTVDGFDPLGPWPEGPLFASLDLDAIDQAHAPGVSAMNPAGWSSREAASWARAAGRARGVRAFDVMELAPELDPDGRTARLAVRLVLAFLQGLSLRPTSP